MLRKAGEIEVELACSERRIAAFEAGTCMKPLQLDVTWIEFSGTQVVALCGIPFAMNPMHFRPSQKQWCALRLGSDLPIEVGNPLVEIAMGMGYCRRQDADRPHQYL